MTASAQGPMCVRTSPWEPRRGQRGRHDDGGVICAGAADTPHGVRRPRVAGGRSASTTQTRATVLNGNPWERRSPWGPRGRGSAHSGSRAGGAQGPEGLEHMRAADRRNDGAAILHEERHRVVSAGSRCQHGHACHRNVDVHDVEGGCPAGEEALLGITSPPRDGGSKVARGHRGNNVRVVVLPRHSRAKDRRTGR